MELVELVEGLSKLCDKSVKRKIAPILLLMQDVVESAEGVPSTFPLLRNALVPLPARPSGASGEQAGEETPSGKTGVPESPGFVSDGRLLPHFTALSLHWLLLIVLIVASQIVSTWLSGCEGESCGMQ